MSPVEKTSAGKKGRVNVNGDINKLKRGFAYNLFYKQGKTIHTATMNDYYLAVAHTVRDRMQYLFVNSTEALLEKGGKTVCYLSAEFLMGPHLGNNLINLGMYEDVAQAAEETGLDLQAILNHEEEPGLGNGGLGRLAGCLLPRFPGHPADSGNRLRHPLRVRHV